MDLNAFIKLHAIEFGDESIVTTPMLINIEHLSFVQPVTARMRRQVMEAQEANNIIRENKGLRPEPLKELPANCSYVKGLDPKGTAMYFEESFEEIEHKLLRAGVYWNGSE